MCAACVEASVGDRPSVLSGACRAVPGRPEAAERLLAEALAGRQERYPGAVVEHRVVHGRAREALSEPSRSAQLLVVGARERGGFAGLFLGPVGQALLHHAHCPVVVVRGMTERY